MPNHLANIPLEQVVPDAGERAQIEGRAIVVKILKPLPVEAIVRGYLIGSAGKITKNQEMCAVSNCLLVCSKRNNCPKHLYTLNKSGC